MRARIRVVQIRTCLFASLYNSGYVRILIHINMDIDVVAVPCCSTAGAMRLYMPGSMKKVDITALSGTGGGHDEGLSHIKNRYISLDQ